MSPRQDPRPTVAHGAGLAGLVVLALTGLTGLALGGACGEPELELRGTLDRVVGETVQLQLVEGDPGFSGEVELTDSEKATFKAGALKISTSGDKKLSFLVPPAIAAGPAVARVKRKDEDGAYDVPLQINRLVVAATSSGVVELIPLTPSTLSAGTLPDVDAAGGHLALSPSGGEVAVLAKDEISVHALGKTPRRITGLQQTGGVAMAAIPDGVVICTSSTIVVTKYAPKVESANTTFSGCQGVAADATGTIAVILHACDTNSDTVMEDCLTTMKLGSTISLGTPFSVDGKASASYVAMRADGKAAVVGDSEALYGVWLDGGTAKLTSVPEWPQSAVPAGISLGSSSLGDLFAVVDSYTQSIYFVAFQDDVKTLKKISSLALSEPPSAIAFGRAAELLIAAGTKLYATDAQFMNPKATLLGLTTSNPVKALLVQP